MTTRVAITSSLVLTAMLLLPSSMASAELGACLNDAKKLCPGVQPGGGKVRECLKTNVKDLSDDCKENLVKAVNIKACAPDVKQFCAGTEPGEDRIKACMKTHLADLSDACKVALANAAAGAGED